MPNLTLLAYHTYIPNKRNKSLSPLSSPNKATQNNSTKWQHWGWVQNSSWISAWEPLLPLKMATISWPGFQLECHGYHSKWLPFSKVPEPWGTAELPLQPSTSQDLLCFAYLQAVFSFCWQTPMVYLRMLRVKQEVCSWSSYGECSSTTSAVLKTLQTMPCSCMIFGGFGVWVRAQPSHPASTASENHTWMRHAFKNTSWVLTDAAISLEIWCVTFWYMCHRLVITALW